MASDAEKIAERRSKGRARAANEAARQQAAIGTYLQQGHSPNEVQDRVRAWKALRLMKVLQTQQGHREKTRQIRKLTKSQQDEARSQRKTQKERAETA